VSPARAPGSDPRRHPRGRRAVAARLRPPRRADHRRKTAGELDQGLRFSFGYAGSAVHDVASSQQRAVAIDDVVALSDAVQVSRVLGEFPKPDPSLPTEGSVAYELRLRWRAQREGRERLSGACYAILTGLESNLGGNRDKAAAGSRWISRCGAQSASSRRGKIRARTGVREGRRSGRTAHGSRGQVVGGCHAAPHPTGGRVRSETAFPSRKSLWPIYHRYPTNGHHRCVPQDGSDQGQRRWLLIEGLFAAVQPIRKPVASLHDPRLGSFCFPNRTRA
jgi:hypothetical protein